MDDLSIILLTLNLDCCCLVTASSSTGNTTSGKKQGKSKSAAAAGTKKVNVNESQMDLLLEMLRTADITSTDPEENKTLLQLEGTVHVDNVPFYWEREREERERERENILTHWFAWSLLWSAYPLCTIAWPDSIENIFTFCEYSVVFML